MCQNYNFRCKLLPPHSFIFHWYVRFQRSAIRIIFDRPLSTLARCVRYRVDQIDAASATSHTHKAGRERSYARIRTYIYVLTEKTSSTISLSRVKCRSAVDVMVEVNVGIASVPRPNENVLIVCHQEMAVARTLLLTQPYPALVPVHDASVPPCNDLPTASTSSPSAVDLQPNQSLSDNASSITHRYPSAASSMCSPNSAFPRSSLPPLPSSTPLANPSFVWESLDSKSFIQSVSCAYSEVVHWKNTFTVP